MDTILQHLEAALGSLISDVEQSPAVKDLQDRLGALKADVETILGVQPKNEASVAQSQEQAAAESVGTDTAQEETAEKAAPADGSTVDPDAMH